MRNKFFKEVPIYIGASVILLVILFLSIGFAVTIGSVDISIKEVYQVILYKLLNIGDSYIGTGAVADVVWLIRMPRIVLAIAVGVGLSVVGIVMQAIVKNPLADPYILGVSSGASLGATLAVVLGIGSSFGSNSLGIMGFIGAFGVSILVLIISNIGGRSNSIKLLLAGMALSSVCSSFSSFLVYISDDSQKLKTITFWLMGSLAGAKWNEIVIIMPIIILGVIFFMHKFRIIYLVITSLMIGLLVYVSGMIGFVGLIIPHIVRMIFGTDHKKIIPISALLGAIILIWADVLSRALIKGTEIPIGIVISIIGSPLFVWLMIKKNYGFGGSK